jgi:hypothetical protein
MATVNSTPNLFSYRSLSLVWRPRIDGDVVMRNTFESMAQGEFAKVRGSVYSSIFSPRC